MITFPPYAIDAKNYIQGPGLVYYAPYVAAGADPDTNYWHQNVDSYPIDTGLFIGGSSHTGGAYPAGTDHIGWTTAIQIGGHATGWMDYPADGSSGASPYTSSLVGTGIDISQWANYGVYLHAPTGTPTAAFVATAGTNWLGTDVNPTGWVDLAVLNVYTASAGPAMEFVGDGVSALTKILSFGTAGTVGPIIQGSQISGALNAQTATGTGAILLRVQGGGYTTAKVNRQVGFDFLSTEVWAAGHAGNKITASTTAIGSTTITQRLQIDENGLTIVGGISQTLKTTNYNSVATAGWGVPAIYGSGRVTAQAAARYSVG